MVDTIPASVDYERTVKTCKARYASHLTAHTFLCPPTITTGSHGSISSKAKQVNNDNVKATLKDVVLATQVP